MRRRIRTTTERVTRTRVKDKQNIYKNNVYSEYLKTGIMKCETCFKTMKKEDNKGKKWTTNCEHNKGTILLIG